MRCLAECKARFIKRQSEKFKQHLLCNQDTCTHAKL